MNAGNNTRSPGGLDDNANSLDGNARAAELEIVWSSPVSTGSGWESTFASSVQPPATEPGAIQTQRPMKHMVAFESDLLDNAFVHWDHERPTLEMIAGYKQDAPNEPDGWPAESIASGQAALADEMDSAITLIGPAGEALADGITPFQPDMSGGAPGPAQVPKHGIEDPRKGWRPTGMVFFETLSTPPRGTVYSSNLLDALSDQPHLQAAVALAKNAVVPSDSDGTEVPAPFFDFPEDVAPAPPDDTEDFPLEPIVVKGGGSGGGGTVFIRLFGRMVMLGLALFGFALVAVFVMYVWYATQRLYDDDNTTSRSIVVTITPGESFRSVVNEMSKDGLLKGFMGLDDRYLMRYLAYFYQDSDKVKPGVYRFPAGQNLDDVYRKLIQGSKDYKITIPEGKTAHEVGQLVARQYTTFDAAYFDQLIKDPLFIKSVGVDAPTLEGYLYPSTYYFGPGMKEEELIRLMVSTFHKKMEGIQDKITSDGLSLQQHVVMASLIEREARTDEDRPIIASVIFNRLEKGMPLQIDATVNYALDNWRRLSNRDYETSHPYNTYKIKGLPPGPIASPRIESILATYTAPETNYLYYVHKGDGHHAFAETYAQHQANVGRYIRERNLPGMANASDSSVSNKPGAEIHFDLTNEQEPPAEQSADAPADTKQPALAEDAPVVESGESDAAKDTRTESAEKTPAPKSY